MIAYSLVLSVFKLLQRFTLSLLFSVQPMVSFVVFTTDTALGSLHAFITFERLCIKVTV